MEHYQQMEQPKKRRGKQSAAEAEQTKASIIRAAAVCFSDQGFDATTLRAIADKANVAHGTLRHHFGSKLNIWKAVFDNVLQHYQKRMLPIISQAAQDPEPLKAFQKVVRAFIEVSINSPKIARLLMMEGAQYNERFDYLSSHFKQLHTLIEGLFIKAQQTSKQLYHYSNDSFFLSLLSLTFFPLIFPDYNRALPNAVFDDTSAKVDFIMKVLFPMANDD